MDIKCSAGKCLWKAFLNQTGKPLRASSCINLHAFTMKQTWFAGICTWNLEFKQIGTLSAFTYYFIKYHLDLFLQGRRSLSLELSGEKNEEELYLSYVCFLQKYH